MDALHFALTSEQTATEGRIFYLEVIQSCVYPNRWQSLWQNPEGLPEKYTNLYSKSLSITDDLKWEKKF